MPPMGNGNGSGNGNDERRITYFATTHTRGKREMFGIRAVDRGKHMYVIGKTGMGKSTMLENMAIQDIQNGEGIAYIDPHGSTAEKLLDFVPQERLKDVLYFAPFDTEYPVGFNVMEDVGYDKRHLVVSGLMGAFKRIWVDTWSARMEYILQNVLLALLEYPDTTLLDVNRMLINKPFRNAVIEKITDPVVRSFWVDEFASYTDRYTQEATPAIQNKVGQFVANPLIRNIVGQPKSTFDLRKMMDEKKIFIVNLSKGRMGESNAALLGSMLTVKLYLAAMSRADEPAARLARLPRCYFYVDEFQSMMNEAFADILSESRKYKLALTLANQYIEQMEENVRNAVFGNVGTLITFRVGPFDAEVLKTVFEPTFQPEDLVNLGIGQIYLTLMIDGVGSAPFSADTIPPIEAPHISYREDVIVSSRASYARQRSDVEKIIAQRQQEFVAPPKPAKDQRDGGPRRDYGNNSGNTFQRSNPPQQPPQNREYRENRDQSQPRLSPIQMTPQHARPKPPEKEKQPGAASQERNALKDAIAAARVVEKPAPGPVVVNEGRSPLDVLRSRKDYKGPSAPKPAVPPTQEEKPNAQEKPVEEKKPEPEKRESQEKKPEPEAKREEIKRQEAKTAEVDRREEVSTEDLKKILRGE